MLVSLLAGGRSSEAATHGSTRRLALLKVGMRIEAKGEMSAGELVAIRVRPERQDTGYLIKGKLEAVDPAAPSVRLLGRDWLLAAGAAILDAAGAPIPLAELRPGAAVALQGPEQGGAALPATRLRIIRELIAPAEIEGRVERIQILDDRQAELEIAGMIVRVDDRTRGDELLGPGWSSRGDGESFRGTIELFRGATLGGELQVETRGQTGSAGPDERTRLSAQLEIRWALDPRTSAFVELLSDGDLEPGQQTGRARLGEAYLYRTGMLGAPLTLQLGRLDFEDRHEWIADERLDGLRLRANFGELELDGAWLTAFHGASGRGQDSINLWGAATYHFGRGWSAGGFLLDRHGHQREPFSPRLAGAVLEGRWGAGLSFSALSAMNRGSDAGIALRGWGADLRGTYIARRLPARPWLAFGWARGTGDRIAGDGRSESFRQGGLQDNEDRFGGVVDFYSYGEVLRPELSNLVIGSLGAGFRPHPRWSLELMYHRYHQDRASSRPMISTLAARPDGEHRDLGDGLDLIAGAVRLGSFDLEAAFGWFWPGAAYPGLEQSRSVRAELEFNF